jgi:nitroimidazol reductase NimA-like FMN-containing flavoprotein (pyridoxamine 5'-phosphate oxidase superfamily)
MAPKTGKPFMPGYDMMFKKGRKSPSWNWAATRFAKSHNYWIATTRPDGRPHVMPIWGVWHNNTFHFSTGPQSRKGRNMARNPNCVVCTEDAAEAIIMEGKAQKLGAGTREAKDAYEEKYKSSLYDPVYTIKPRVVFGFVENGAFDPVRWSF